MLLQTQTYDIAKKDFLIKKLNSQTDSNFHVDIKRNSLVRFTHKAAREVRKFPSAEAVHF